MLLNGPKASAFLTRQCLLVLQATLGCYKAVHAEAGLRCEAAALVQALTYFAVRPGAGCSCLLPCEAHKSVFAGAS